MRKIDKKLPIQSFVDFVRTKNPLNWKDCDGNVKKETKEFILLEEQNLLCGYTEIFINNEDCHIDHYVKRDINNNLCYNWDNLIVAVNDDDFGAKHKDGRNGVKNIRDYTQIFNPIVDRTQDFFYYTTDGKIHPTNNLNKAKALKTIEIFNLNHSSLKTRRKNLMLLINSLKQGNRANADIIIDIENQGFTSFAEYALSTYF